jgi:BioD-like phosphotransacetylase family protein
MRQLYLAATAQNRGKTTAALGLLHGFIKRGLRTGFLKPVGQRTVIEDGQPADEDAVLMRETFRLPEPYPLMSPVHIPRGFTRSFINGEVVEDLAARIHAAHRSYFEHDVLLIEGTGHAGVGSVIDLSNAVVAQMLGAPAIIISEGGIGRPIDEIVLNAALFAARGVRVAGAIVNKVDAEARPSLSRIIERGLARHGIPLLGTLPRQPILSNPTLEMILEGVRGDLIHPGPDLDLVIGGVAIGAMESRHMLQHIRPGSLVIVPGDREDLIGAIARAHRTEAAGGQVPAVRTAIGLVMTGGWIPRQAVLEEVRRADLFAVLVTDDTYSVASNVHDLLVKTHAADKEKIELIKALVADHLDVDRVLEVAVEAPREAGARS